MTYVGTFWKDETMAQMRTCMEYFWDYAIVHGGELALQRNRNTRAGAKSILCYRRPGSNTMPRIEVQGTYLGSGADKDYHYWGQPVDEAAYYIACFSEAGNLVLDPFMGGGTTAAACIDSHRSWIGFEKNEKHARIAQQRIAT